MQATTELVEVSYDGDRVVAVMLRDKEGNYRAVKCHEIVRRRTQTEARKKMAEVNGDRGTDMVKSKIVESMGPDNEPGHYSDLQVLKSAAGWYIGTIWQGDDGWTEPGSRDSGYFKTQAQAQRCLNRIDVTNDRDTLRDIEDLLRD